MDHVNSIRPDDGTSLRALSEVLPAAPASRREDSRTTGEGQPDSERVLREPGNGLKATTPSEGGARQNGRKRKRSKQGDLLGTTRSSWPRGPKNRPTGVRASIVAKKRVTSVEPRDAGRWKDQEQNNGRQTDASARQGYAAVGVPPSAIDLADTAGLAEILMSAQSRHLIETPPTGKPDAGNPPVRFGGRGGATSAIPTPIPQSKDGALHNRGHWRRKRG